MSEQITLDVTYLDVNGVPQTTTIIADYLIDLGNDNFKNADAKTSILEDLVNKPSLLSTCQENQKIIYPLIDAIGTPQNTITSVKMRGQGAIEAFGKIGDINLQKGVDFYVNSDVNDFRQYIIRGLNK